MAMGMSLRCADLIVAAGLIPEANHIYIQHNEGVIATFFDQGCITEADMFASLDGKESVWFRYMVSYAWSLLYILSVGMCWGVCTAWYITVVS